MKKLAIRLGTWGATLGMLAGVVELSIGAHICPWIGNKENPAVLGLVTILLSGLALAAFIVVRKQEPRTNDGKLAILLGALLPAAICFTTVGRLWYLPGALLMVAAALLAYEFWMTPQAKVSPGTSGRTWRRMAGIGSLVILLSIGLAFWKNTFGLFHAEVLVMADRIRFDVMPMDFVRRTTLSNGAMIHENVEAGQVMTIYVILNSWRHARIHRQFDGVTLVYSYWRRHCLSGVAALPGFAARDPGAGALCARLSCLAQVIGMGLVCFSDRNEFDPGRGFSSPGRSIQDLMTHSTLISQNKKEA